MKTLILILLITFSCYLVAGKHIGYKPELVEKLEPTDLPILHFDKYVLNFGQVIIGEEKEVEVYVNSGKKTVYIYGASIHQEFDDFSVLDTVSIDNSIRIGNYVGKNFKIKFKPTLLAEYYGEFIIQADVFGIVPIKLIGKGVEYRTNIRLSTNQLRFHTTTETDTSSLFLTISREGSGTLEVKDLSIEQKDSNFKITKFVQTPVEVNEDSITIKVDFFANKS